MTGNRKFRSPAILNIFGSNIGSPSEVINISILAGRDVCLLFSFCHLQRHAGRDPIAALLKTCCLKNHKPRQALAAATVAAGGASEKHDVEAVPDLSSLSST